jgi:hypothetical protein
MHASPTSTPSILWREVREVVLARDHRACVSCGNAPKQGELDIHHLVPRAAGGLDDPSNLITLCDGCHAARHPNLQGTLARRTIERWGLRLAHWQHPASVEDYLQEFGRAGCDGKASVAVLFTGAKDEELLRYMAERTIQEAPASENSREEALEARYRAIAQMQRQATNRDACFREMIVRFFGENASTTKRSLALRIVEWIFQKKRRVPKTERCCDYCDAVTPGNVLAWARFIFLKGKLS